MARAQESPAESEGAPEAPPRVRELAIGYLLDGSDLSGAGIEGGPASVRALMERMRERLEATPRLREAMAAAGYGEIVCRACAEPFDMLQRLRAEEFEAAFATGVIYARHLLARDPRAAPRPPPYEPVLQTRYLKGDVADGPGPGVYRKGSIFLGPGSSLWNTPEPTEAELRAELARVRLAVPDSFSATGYLYPWLRIRERHPGIRPPSPIFCRSGEEVVRHVVSGLAAAGACESRLLEGRPGVREIDRTPLVPTDPFLLRRDLAGTEAPTGDRPARGGIDAAESEREADAGRTEAERAEAARRLGRELATAIRSFFSTPPPPAPDLRFEPAERRSYEPMVRALERFDAALRE